MPRLRLTVGMQFAAVTVLCTALVMAVSIGIAYERILNGDLTQAEEIAASRTARINAAVRIVFEKTFDVLGTAHDTLVAFKDDGITDAPAYASVLKRVIDPDRFGTWVVWDGSDAPADQRDAAGRYSLYWHQNGIDLLKEQVPAAILDSELYQVPRSGQAFLLEPHAIDAEHGDPTLVTSFAQPLEHDGKIVGALAVDVKLEAIVGALEAIALPPSASIAIVSDGGEVAMSTDRNENGKPVTSLGRSLSRLYGMARRGNGSEHVAAPAGNGRMLVSWGKIRFGGLQNPWYLVVRMPEQPLARVATGDRMVMAAGALAAMAIILLVVLLAMDTIVARPLRTLSKIIGGLGDGLFDFRVGGLHRTDEVGDIARAVERLQQSGLEIARLHEARGDSEFEMRSARRGELDDISSRFSQSIETVVRTLGEVARTVEARSREVASASDEAVSLLGDVSGAAEAAKVGMTSAANASSSLAATVEAIGERTREGIAATARVEGRAASTERSIRDLRETVGSIDGVAALIRDIAGQINLIALNATIEAARAGDAGRGFAVVAAEIKVLAMATSKATEQIGAHIASVGGASDVAEANVAAMTRAFQEMREIAGGVASFLEMQMDATVEIADVVGAAMRNAGEVRRDVDALVGSSDRIHGAADVMLRQCAALTGVVARLESEARSFIQSIDAA